MYGRSGAELVRELTFDDHQIRRFNVRSSFFCCRNQTCGEELSTFSFFLYRSLNCIEALLLLI